MLSLQDVVAIFLQLKFVFYVNPVADIFCVISLISGPVTRLNSNVCNVSLTDAKQNLLDIYIHGAAWIRPLITQGT